jgi:hypothetical protein
MAMRGREKTDLTAQFLDLYAERFEVATLGGHAAAVAARPELPVVTPGGHRPRPARRPAVA